MIDALAELGYHPWEIAEACPFHGFDACTCFDVEDDDDGWYVPYEDVTEAFEREAERAALARSGEVW
jgi:hypothetical protein